MTRKTAGVLASVVLLTTAACGGQGHEERTDVNACRAAMVQRFHDALSTVSPTAPEPTGTPAACAGVSQEDLLKIVAEIFSTESPGAE